MRLDNHFFSNQISSRYYLKIIRLPEFQAKSFLIRNLAGGFNRDTPLDNKLKIIRDMNGNGS